MASGQTVHDAISQCAYTSCAPALVMLGLEKAIMEGQDVNMRLGDRQLTALHRVIDCFDPSLPLVQLLVQNKADLNATDVEGETALMSAAFMQEPTCVALLLGARADPKMRDAEGDTALDWSRVQRWRRGATTNTECRQLLEQAIDI